MCATFSLLGTTAYIMLYYIVVCSYEESNSVLLVADGAPLLLLCRQQGEEPTKRRMECGTADETSMPPLKCRWMLWLGCLSITTVHGACDCPRCLCLVNLGIHAPHPLDLWGIIIKSPKPPILLNFEHRKHLGPCRQRPLSSLE